MNFNLNCIGCNIKQVLTVTDLVKSDFDCKEAIMREVLGYLQNTDYKRANPEVMKGTWDIITKHIKNTNPYEGIKSYYNKQALHVADKIRNLIYTSDDAFHVALKIAITANLIDFAAAHTFDENMLLEKINTINEKTMPIDDSQKLYERLKRAKTLLYLGDNCGEIVMDKIFIEYIKATFPTLTVYFGVRGEAIVNDVTIEDANMVQMEEVAEVISNGDGSLGTVIEKTSTAFREIFYQADVIIAKGQGNYESLSESNRNHIFFLFMAKCDVVATSLKVAALSIVCAEHHCQETKVSQNKQQITGVILDWAGTTVDFGCFAPVQVFLRIFEESGIAVTLEEARAPMGMLKRDHIRVMLEMPRINELWREKIGRCANEQDIDVLYARFEAALFATLAEYTKPLPGVVETIRLLRERNLKIGSTTGYTAEMMKIVTAGAAEKGYIPDYWVTPEATGWSGRPYPYMIFRNMEALRLPAPWMVVKVGDTAADIEEGVRAGVWSVGVAIGSSQMGLSEQDYAILTEKEKNKRILIAEQAFYGYGAHFVLRSLRELPALVERINRLLEQGIRPERYNRSRQSQTDNVRS